MGGGSCEVRGKKKKREDTDPLRTVTRRGIQNGEDGTRHGDLEACKFAGRKAPWGRQRTLPVQEWGQTDNPQEHGGIFAGDPGGCELDGAEPGAQNGLREPQTDQDREAETYGYFPG